MVKYIRPQMDVKEFSKEIVLDASSGGGSSEMTNCNCNIGIGYDTTGGSGGSGGGARSVGDDFIIG